MRFELSPSSFSVRILSLRQLSSVLALPLFVTDAEFQSCCRTQFQVGDMVFDFGS